MTAKDAPSKEQNAAKERRGLQAIMTAQLAFRQFGLLLLAGFVLFLMWFRFHYFGADFEYLSSAGPIQWKFISINILLFGTLVYVLLNGLLFALGPSERSFNFFFGAMILGLLVLNYDHSILDWLWIAAKSVATPAIDNDVDFWKILIAGAFFLIIISMHYNVLSDDFARRMIRRGVPTSEAARIRPGMFKILVPLVITAGAVATGLALVAEFSALIFSGHGLAPKVQLFLLAALVIPMAFLIRNILREMSKEHARGPNGGPNR